MATPKPIKSARHHWWPETLSDYWRDDAGFCHRLSWDGKDVPSNPANFGAITNAHHIRLADEPTPWDGSIEPQFARADDVLSSLIERLGGLHSKISDPRSTLIDRISPQVVLDQLVFDLAECGISLALRSPRFRYLVREGTIDLQRRIGFQRPDVDDTLISMNMNGCLKRFTQDVGRRGKWAILFSDVQEFIFGDGFLHNFTNTSAVPLNPRILLPLTPTIAAFYIRPLQYPSRPRLMTLRLERAEVELVNSITQIYSRDCVFYRSQKPADTSLLARHAHQCFDYDKQPWLAGLIEAMMSFHHPERRREEM